MMAVMSKSCYRWDFPITNQETLLKAQSYQTSSDYVLTTFCSEWDGHQKVLSSFKVLDVLANSGSLYYVQVVCTQFEPVRKEHSKNEFGVNEV